MDPATPHCAGICPRTEELERLLDVGEADEAVRAHVRACRRCQEQLDALSDDAALAEVAKRDGPLRLGPDEQYEYRQLVASVLARDRDWSPPRTGAADREGELGALAGYLESNGYLVRKELGRGGMGIVLLAFSEALQRNVALKVLRAELAADARARERFVREARAAARVRHDNVVIVHGVVNPPGGFPYCVLEYLAGPSLEERLRVEGRFAPAAAAAVLAQVADGVAAAHAAGLVHRDVKPSNILFDPPTGRAKVVDFGLARSVERDVSLTQEGTVAGTPAYMSPEQVRGSETVGPASDVFSLGVTLYEVITGEPPFRGSPHLVAQQILDEAPRPPRALNDAVPRDLETICLKCLEKSPARRYADASALAADLRRFSSGEPVIARPLSWWGRGTRWARRRPAFAALGVFSTAAALMLMLGGFVYGERMRAANRRAEVNFQRALEAVNRMLTRVGGEGLAGVPEMEPVRRELLNDAVAFLGGLRAERAEMTRPEVRRQLAVAHRHLGHLHELLVEFDQAEAEYRQAIFEQSQLHAQRPGRSDDRVELAQSRRDLVGVLLGWQHRHAEAEAEFLGARALWEPLSRNDPGARQMAAFCAVQLARLCQFTGRFAEAERYASDASALLDRLSESDSVDPAVRAEALVQLANVELYLNKVDDAERLYRRGLALAPSDTSGRPGPAGSFDAIRASCHEGLGSVLVIQKRSADASPLLAQAIEIRERLAARAPKAPGTRDDLARSLNAQGLLLRAEGRNGDAEGPLRRSVDMREELVRRYPGITIFRRRLAESYLNLGSIYQATGRGAETREAYGKALSVVKAIRAEHPGDPILVDLLAGVLTNLGLTLTGEGDLRGALGRLDEAGAALESAYGTLPDASSARSALYKACGARAQAHSALGRHAEAVRDWDRVIALAWPLDRPVLVLMRCVDQLHAGQWRDAAAAAEALAALPDSGGERFYNSACVLSLSAAAGEKADDAESRRLARGYADAAFGLLERARRTGYFHSEASRGLLDTDHDLDPLRGRRDFQLLRLDAAFPPDPFHK